MPHIMHALPQQALILSPTHIHARPDLEQVLPVSWQAAVQSHAQLVEGWVHSLWIMVQLAQRHQQIRRSPAAQTTEVTFALQCL